MENFFNWMVKPISQEELVIWFNVHNMHYEKIELYGDIFKSLYIVVSDTFLGNDEVETKIDLTNEDNEKHFEWCWAEIVKYFAKENIIINSEGKHKDYLKSFFLDTFYDPKEKNIKEAIPSFLKDVFELSTHFTKSDLDILTEIYSLLDKNISYF
jgi:hypothetical protein